MTILRSRRGSHLERKIFADENTSINIHFSIISWESLLSQKSFRISTLHGLECNCRNTSCPGKILWTNNQLVLVHGFFREIKTMSVWEAKHFGAQRSNSHAESWLGLEMARPPHYTHGSGSCSSIIHRTSSKSIVRPLWLGFLGIRTPFSSTTPCTRCALGITIVSASGLCWGGCLIWSGCICWRFPRCVQKARMGGFDSVHVPNNQAPTNSTWSPGWAFPRRHNKAMAANNRFPPSLAGGNIYDDVTLSGLSANESKRT